MALERDGGSAGGTLVGGLGGRPEPPISMIGSAGGALVGGLGGARSPPSQ
jgi:hypothetical protein